MSVELLRFPEVQVVIAKDAATSWKVCRVSVETPSDLEPAIGAEVEELGDLDRDASLTHDPSVEAV